MGNENSIGITVDEFLENIDDNKMLQISNESLEKYVKGLAETLEFVLDNNLKELHLFQTSTNFNSAKNRLVALNANYTSNLPSLNSDEISFISKTTYNDYYLVIEIINNVYGLFLIQPKISRAEMKYKHSECEKAFKKEDFKHCRNDLYKMYEINKYELLNLSKNIFLIKSASENDYNKFLKVCKIISKLLKSYTNSKEFECYECILRIIKLFTLSQSFLTDFFTETTDLIINLLSNKKKVYDEKFYLMIIDLIETLFLRIMINSQLTISYFFKLRKFFNLLKKIDNINFLKVKELQFKYMELVFIMISYIKVLDSYGKKNQNSYIKEECESYVSSILVSSKLKLNNTTFFICF